LVLKTNNLLMAKKRKPASSHSVKHKRFIKTGSEENYRTRFGLTQSDLAMLLGVKTSAVVSSEHNYRDLPAEASLKLAQLIIKFEAASLPESQDQALHPGEDSSAFTCIKASSKMLARAEKANACAGN
jgi:DNA-binding XRE family transcriptional regulator